MGRCLETLGVVVESTWRLLHLLTVQHLKKESYKLAAFAATLCIFVKVVSSKANMQSTFLKIVFLYLVRNCSVVTRPLVVLIFSTLS
jgi:hypothetical protein